MAVGAVSEGDSTTNYNITNNVSEDHNPQHSQSLIAPASARNSGTPASASSTWSDAVDQQTDLVTTYRRCASYQAEYQSYRYKDTPTEMQWKRYSDSDIRTEIE